MKDIQKIWSDIVYKSFKLVSTTHCELQRDFPMLFRSLSLSTSKDCPTGLLPIENVRKFFFIWGLIRVMYYGVEL